MSKRFQVVSTAIVIVCVIILAGIVRVMFMPECDGLTMSENCIWIAGNHGDPTGRSFIDIFGIPFWLGK
jgi:hypothetical protein